MYYLCVILEHSHDESVIGHPIRVLKRSDSLDPITDEIKRLVLDGYRRSDLMVFKGIEFEVLCRVIYKEEG